MLRLLTRIRNSLNARQREAFDALLNDNVRVSAMLDFLEELQGYQSATAFDRQLSQASLKFLGFEILRQALPEIGFETRRIAIESAITASKPWLSQRVSPGPAATVLVDAGIGRDFRRTERISRAVIPMAKRSLLSATASVARADAVSSLASAVSLWRGVSMYPFLPLPARFHSMAVQELATEWALRATRGLVGLMVSAAAKTALESMQRGSGLRVLTVSQEAERWARQHSGRLMTRLSDQQRESLRMVIGDIYSQGIGQTEAARMIRRTIGLRPDQYVALRNYERGLRGATGAIDRARLVLAYATRLHSQRADLIARTESLMALNQGKLALWTQAARNGALPDDAVKRWVVAPEEAGARNDKVCKLCRPLDGKETPVLEQFQIGRGSDDYVDGPPLHPRCRCTVVLSTPGENLLIIGSGLRSLLRAA